MLEQVKDREFMLDLCIKLAHHSTAIEGNTLSLDEVTKILRENYTPRQMSQNEFYEIKNYGKAFELLSDCLKAKELLSPELMKEFHALLLDNLLASKGEFKKSRNPKPDFDTLSPYQADYILQEWCDSLYFVFTNEKSDEHKLEAILQSHIHFERMRPFSDGNGRVGKLLIVYSCLEQDLMPVIIPKDCKNRYIEILAQHDLNGFLEIVQTLNSNLL